MSETVKLVIEIPKEDYEYYLKLKGNLCVIDRQVIISGIPLDDIKAEIEKKCDRINSIASVLRYPQHREIQELLCEILASIDKESEEV